MGCSLSWSWKFINIFILNKIDYCSKDGDNNIIDKFNSKNNQENMNFI